MANLEKQMGTRDSKGDSVEHLDERSDGGAIPVAVPGLEVEVRRGAARVLAGLLCGEELGARRPLRVEEPLADHQGIGAVCLAPGPRDDATEVGVRGCEPRGAVGHVGGAVEEEGVMRVGGVGSGHGGGGRRTWGGHAAARAEGEVDEGRGGDSRSGSGGAERRRHVSRVWWGLGLCAVNVRRFAGCVGEGPEGDPIYIFRTAHEQNPSSACPN